MIICGLEKHGTDTYSPPGLLKCWARVSRLKISRLYWLEIVNTFSRKKQIRFSFRCRIPYQLHIGVNRPTQYKFLNRIPEACHDMFVTLQIGRAQTKQYRNRTKTTDKEATHIVFSQFLGYSRTALCSTVRDQGLQSELLDVDAW